MTDLGQMAYQAGNPWLRPKLSGAAAASGHHRLYQVDNSTKISIEANLDISIEVNSEKTKYMIISCNQNIIIEDHRDKTCSVHF